MFDLGNRKLIEMLEKEIERLEKERIDFIKTVEYLTNKVEELKNEKDELELELGQTKFALKQAKKNSDFLYKAQNEIIQKKKDEINEITNKYFFQEKCYTIKIDKYKATTYEDICVEVAPIDYVEMKDKISKKFYKINNKSYIYFTSNNTSHCLFNNSYIRSMFIDYEIPTYNGIPFRSLQDLYKIIDFFNSEKYVDYRTERIKAEIKNRIVFSRNNNKLSFYIIVDNDKIIFDDRYIKKFENFQFSSTLNKIKTCPIQYIITYKNNTFRTINEFKKLLKKDCYSNNELLTKILTTLKTTN